MAANSLWSLRNFSANSAGSARTAIMLPGSQHSSRKIACRNTAVRASSTSMKPPTAAAANDPRLAPSTISGNTPELTRHCASEYSTMNIAGCVNRVRANGSALRWPSE